MKVTNKLNLPVPIYNAVANDPYCNGGADISVTSLLAPPRQTALRAMHEADLEEDCSDRIWSLLGQLTHGILERANTTAIAERRLFLTVEGWKVSGGMDVYYDHGLLQDYKLTTAYKFQNGKVPEEYEQQLNCYAEILRQNGEKVTQLQIVAILRDWSKLEAARDRTYPQSAVMILDIPLWPAAEAASFIRTRVILHKLARISLPMCTKEERWAKPDVYAVMKDGAKRATKLFDTQHEADRFISEQKNPKEFVVELREGENVRCDNYCIVANFCKAKQVGKEPVDAEIAI